MEDKVPEEKVIIKYSSYTPAQKRATQKYRHNNKEKVNEQRKKYYLSRKEKDPEFLEYKRQKAKEYYQRKKATKDVEPEVAEEVEPTPEPKPIIERGGFVEVSDEVLRAKPKRIRKKKETPEVLEEVIEEVEHTPVSKPIIKHVGFVEVSDEVLRAKPKRISKKKETPEVTEEPSEENVEEEKVEEPKKKRASKRKSKEV